MVVTVIATGFGADGDAKPQTNETKSAPAEQTPAQSDNGVDDNDVIDIFNMFKNK